MNQSCWCAKQLSIHNAVSRRYFPCYLSHWQSLFKNYGNRSLFINNNLFLRLIPLKYVVSWSYNISLPYVFVRNKTLLFCLIFLPSKYLSSIVKLPFSGHLLNELVSFNLIMCLVRPKNLQFFFFLSFLFFSYNPVLKNLSGHRRKLLGARGWGNCPLNIFKKL